MTAVAWPTIRRLSTHRRLPIAIRSPRRRLGCVWQAAVYRLRERSATGGTFPGDVCHRSCAGAPTGGRTRIPLPRRGGPLDRRDRPPARTRKGHREGIPLRPDGREGAGGQAPLPGRMPRLRETDRGPRRQGRRVPVLQALPSRRDRANPDPRVGARRDARVAGPVRQSAVVNGLVSHPPRPPARWRGTEAPAGRRLAGALDGRRPVRHLGGGAVRRLP